jgi:molybdate transport system substrate-binding protein
VCSSGIAVRVVFAVVLAMLALIPATTVPTLAAPVASALAAPSAQATVTVFAASSLTDAFKDLGATFEQNTGTPVTFNFGSSSQLRTQLEQGAPADVFASADQIQMDAAHTSNVINGADTTFASNRLVLIAPKSNPANIQSAADLARPGIKFVTAAPEVPIGVYTQHVFDKMSQVDVFGADFKDRANANIVSREPNVRQVVSKVQLGEADAAICYLTDVTAQAAPDLLLIPIPDDLNVIATYPIALVAGAAQAELGQAFIDLVLSPTGQGTLQKWNFTTVAPAMLMPAPSTDRVAYAAAR